MKNEEFPTEGLPVGTINVVGDSSFFFFHFLFFSLFFFLFCACSSPNRQVADELNALSYAFHYRNLDSTEHYAHRAIEVSNGYADGMAEAYNHLAFSDIARMRYDEAWQKLDTIALITDNQVELLIAYIQQMRLCQRRSHNREFYDYREKALRCLHRIEEDRATLAPHLQSRYEYAETELAIVTSTYYYYVGLEQQSVDALNRIGWVDSRSSVSESIEDDDMGQLLNYLYNVGAGGIITAGTPEEINQQEFDYLLRCLTLARKYDYPYFVANSMEALAEHLVDSEVRQQLMATNVYAMKYVNTDNVAPDELPSQLADEALCLFQRYGDVYQIAGAYRTLASCSRATSNYASALYYLEQALADSAIYQAPDLVASIREQLSVVYAAIDDKPSSDYNRNIYLDLQEQTRQDRWLEARAGQLDYSVGRLNKLLLVLGMAVVVLLLLILFFVYWHYRSIRRHPLQPVSEEEESMGEQLAQSRLHVERGQRRALEQRAKVSLVNSITPFIDRMLHEVKRATVETDESRRQASLQYIQELTDKINEQNQVLTHWIQLRQGELNLHIESFALQPLFELVAKGKTGFLMKNVQLVVEPTDTVVKADRVLTLFMLNTLADNARKFTDSGGKVTMKAQDMDDYVEISVIDTGQGMTEEQLAHVFDHRKINNATKASSHGFGLLNCRGIIEKYRKLSQIFSVCLLDAESRVGQGSRFFFRLPKGALKLLLALLCLSASVQAQSNYLDQAKTYADSTYFSNINGHYERALLYADSCRTVLNAYYRQQKPDGRDTLEAQGQLSVMPPEVLWLHDSIRLNYDIILDMRNESAVAALALHRFQLYAFNNRIYTLLYKELSADVTLDDYCRKMQQSEANLTTGIILLLLVLLAIVVAVLIQVYHSLNRSARRKQEQQTQLELLSDELRKTELEEANLHVTNAVLDNCLSTLKHETMYYPSRIRQLVDAHDIAPLLDVASYYRELYAILSQQAMRQVERVKLHVHPLSHEILGDDVLLRYLFEILRKSSGQKKLSVSYVPKDSLYMDCVVPMPQLRLTQEQAAMLFSPAIDNIPYLLCRQIVRDHGEATNRRGCGIKAELKDNITTIIITLPRQICKTSK